MALLDRIARWFGHRRYRRVRHLQGIEPSVTGVEGQLVTLEGRVEPLELVYEPIGGDGGVAIAYRAWPPSTTVGVDGATAHGSRAFEVQAQQGVDFMLHCEGGGVLVRVDRGRDIASLHRELLDRYGVGLRAEAEIIAAGSTVRVAGLVTHRRDPSSSPHRAEPYDAVIAAHQLWLVRS